MSLPTAIYNLLIGPLELFYQVLFAAANGIIQNPGLTIIFLSLAVNFLVLPLYKRADAMQEEERRVNMKLQPWVTHIKKNFSGDERFMMIQTYYRQNHYKPTDALKGSVSLLLEIPFFIAAYNFLSELPILQGVSFGPIKDLGTPDGMLVIAGVAINVLPILMTLINFISGAIYTKGFPLKSKIQLYGMATIFLVLLYDSPAGLVFYWTLNNLFSLVKNIFYKLKNPKLVLSILESVSSLALILVVTVICPIVRLRHRLIVCALLLLLQLPIISYVLKKHIARKPMGDATKTDRAIFRVGCIFMVILTGVLIPSAIISSSPAEFLDKTTLTSPLMYVLSTCIFAAGTFLVWFSVFYALANPAGKKAMGLFVWIMLLVTAADYMFFGTEYGTLGANLQFLEKPVFAVRDMAVNAGVILLLMLAAYLIWKYKAELVKFAAVTLTVAAVVMSMLNIFKIQSVIPETIANLESTSDSQVKYPLSKDGENVVVIMLDRAIGAYMPFILDERPDIRDLFAGFTFYPNTISFGVSTNVGSPALYGGYEYTPEAMNTRDDMLLADKHNEALLTMPRIFLDAGYDVTISDPSYAGYSWYSDLSIYDDYPEMNAFHAMGEFECVTADGITANENNLYSNFFLYSLFKVAPVAIQPDIYDTTIGSEVEDPPYRAHFLEAYSMLQNLPKVTEITEGGKNSFIVMTNDCTHEPIYLEKPGYTPPVIVNDGLYANQYPDQLEADGLVLQMTDPVQVKHYQVNMASLLQLGNWFEYLRENDIYDNTKIIIVADHGASLYSQREDMVLPVGYDAMTFNPLLMVKDFNSQEFSIDNAFMTNADVPTLATKDSVENPVNPVSGKPINNDIKYQSPQHVFLSWDNDILTNNGNTFIPAPWIAVQDNIFNPDNWQMIGDDAVTTLPGQN